MDTLREECPWDKKQTFESLRPLTIEETYELGDAILDKDNDALKGELGDLIMHTVFYSKIAEEKNQFDITDVLNEISEKLIYRHPHIYGDEKVENEKDVEKNWEKLKLKKGRKSVLEGVPNSLPALLKATRIQEKVKGIGFDWDNRTQVADKVREEFEELEAEVTQKSSKIENEFGDVLFSLINYARFLKIDPESALERTNKKFKRRFQLMEEMIRKEGKKLGEMDLNDMDIYWERAKEELREKE